MATLRDIRRRIRSVQSTQKITSAMKLVAAAKLRRAQERILAARPYAQKMGELMSNLVTRVTPDVPASSACQVASVPMPSDDTSPMPVMTTRLFNAVAPAFLFYFFPLACASM